MSIRGHRAGGIVRQVLPTTGDHRSGKRQSFSQGRASTRVAHWHSGDESLAITTRFMERASEEADRLIDLIAGADGKTLGLPSPSHPELRLPGQTSRPHSQPCPSADNPNSRQKSARPPDPARASIELSDPAGRYLAMSRVK